MRSIGKIFDLIDAGLDVAEGKSPRREAPEVPRVADRPSSPRATAVDRGGARASRSLPAAGRISGPAFRVVESHDGATGEIVHVVTDGVHRAECNSAEFARRVRDCLG